MKAESALLERIRLGGDDAAVMMEVQATGDQIRAPNLDTLADTMAALANSRGGLLVLGVTPRDLRIRGVPAGAVEALEARVRQACFHALLPPVEPLIRRIELLDDTGTPQVLLEIEVPQGRQLHLSRDRALHRVRGGNKLLSKVAQERLLRERPNQSPAPRAASVGPAPPPVVTTVCDLRVVWLEVEGFRRLQERSFFDFRNPRGEPVEQMIIAGTNGGGKSTLLEALLIGLHREDLLVRDLPKGERAASWRGRLSEGARVSLCVAHGGRYLRVDRSNGRHLWREVADPFAEPGPPVEVDFGPGTGWVEYFSSWRAPALVGPVWPTTGGRKGADTEANRLRNVKQRLLDRRTLRSYTDPSGADPWLARINEAWATFHGDDGTRLADQPVEAGNEAAGFDVFVLEASGRRRCTIDQASAGEIELVCMAGTVAVHDFHGLLLIDEPELHLHPEWQARIVPALRKLAPHAQVVATTHAAAPWDRAANYQRYFLAPPGDPRQSDLSPPPERG